ncbi:9808_t:CDS:2, partial [Dentiscutata erythropus]
IWTTETIYDWDHKKNDWLRLKQFINIDGDVWTYIERSNYENDSLFKSKLDELEDLDQVLAIKQFREADKIQSSNKNMDQVLVDHPEAHFTSQPLSALSYKYKSYMTSIFEKNKITVETNKKLYEENS